jgi:chromosome segregation ATPase
VRLRPEYIGENVTCKFCNKSFTVRSREVEAPAAVRQLQSAAVDAQPSHDISARAQVRVGNAHGDSPADILESSQLFVRVHDQRPEAATESRRQEQALRKDLEQAGAEIVRLHAECASLETKAAQVARLTNELEAARAESARLGQLPAELDALRKERDELLAKQNAAKQEAKQHRQKLGEIGRALNAAVRRQSETQDLHARLESERRRIEQEAVKGQEEARQQLTKLEDARGRLEQEIVARDDQLRVARQEVESVRRERDNLQTETEASRRKTQDWERERETLLNQSRRDQAEQVDALERRWREEQTRQLAERQSQLDSLRKELDQQRHAQTEFTTKAAREAEQLRRERDTAREAGETIHRQKDAEHKALQDRLAEVSRSAQAEQERLQSELGRADAARRQLEQGRLTLQAETQRLRKDFESARQDQEQSRKSAEDRLKALHEDLERGRQERETLRRERDAVKQQASQDQQKTEKDLQEQLTALQRDFDHETEMLKNDASRQVALAESLRQERDVHRRRIETLQQQAREKAETWESERQSLLSKVQASNQQFVELDKRSRAEQAQVAELRKQIDATRDAAPADVVQLQQELGSLRNQLDSANAEMTKVRQQQEQRGQGWTVEKKSLQSHHQEECRRLTEEFEQRLKAEMARCRESYVDQIESLQRECERARSQFDALKQAVYHPEQQAEEEDDGIPRLPEPEADASTEAGPAQEQPPSAEQAQLHAQLRKSRQLLEDQRRQFEQEKQALIAEANRVRQRTGRSSDSYEPAAQGTRRRRTSRLVKVLLYVALFTVSVAIASLIGLTWNKFR